ncbi:MAG: Bax inhibitor-1/YccA family protein [Nitrospinota bacterium]|nr:Bax inhibitor-1/YccA family protein [Nitrospinota bacterium]
MAGRVGSQAIAEENRRFMIRVYNWMTAGLGLTGLVAWIVARDPVMMQLIFGNKILLIGLVIAELGLVFWLAARVMQMSVMTAMSVFMGYSALNGFTLSAIFVVYSTATISSAFLVTAGTFATMSFIGYTTKRDLTNLGGFLMMGLVGIIIASLVNFWFQSPMISWLVTYVGLFIFIGLTAYDTQKIKEMNIIGNEGTDEDTKEAIRGALSLYLDFINMFLFILQIMGGNRD